MLLVSVPVNSRQLVVSGGVESYTQISDPWEVGVSTANPCILQGLPILYFQSDHIKMRG